MEKLRRIVSLWLVLALMLMNTSVTVFDVQAASFEGDIQSGYHVYVNSGVVVSDTATGIAVSTESNDDQVIKADPVDVKNTEVTFTLDQQPSANNTMMIGFTNRYVDGEGSKFPVSFMKSDGRNLANLVLFKYTANDTLELKFVNSLEKANPNNNSYKGYQEVKPKKELVADDGTFVGKKFKVTSYHDGDSFIISVVAEGTSLLKNGIKQNSNTVSVRVSTEGANAILIDRFVDDKGYVVVNPGGFGQVTVNSIAKTTTQPVFNTTNMASEEVAEVAKEEVKEEPAVINKNQVKNNLGKLKDFWNGHPLLGEFEGAAIREIPDFLSDESLSFPYPAMDTEEEVTFGKRFNLVRLLGGWSSKGRNYYGSNLGIEGVSEYDLAYRDENGVIQYRFGEGVPDEQNYIKRRLDYYINLGYTDMRIVLDNVPYCFVQKPVVAKYGQGAIPDNMDEWSAFIEAVCNELVRLYGYDLVNTWSFRAFTESDNPERFIATTQGYCDVYGATAKAVAKVLPNTGFGAYNTMYDLDQHMMDVATYAKENNLKFDWIAISNYFKSPVEDPDIRIKEIAADVEKVRAVAANGEGLPFEIHEYTWLAHVSGLRLLECGARGAAGNFHWLMNLYENGLDSIYHWNVTENITILGPDDESDEDDVRYTFASGMFWLCCVLEQAVGADAYELYVEKPEKADTKQKYKAVGFFGSETDKDMVVLSSYNMDRENLYEDDVTFYIPKTVSPNLSDKKIKFTAMTEENSMYSGLREDLIGAGILTQPKQLATGVVANLGNMVNADPNKAEDAKRFVADNYSKYQAMAEASLTLEDYDAAALVDKGEYYEMTVTMASPMTLVLSFEDKDGSEVSTSLSSPVFTTNEYIKGYPDGTFRPDNDITRAEMSAIINRIVTLDSVNTNELADVSNTHWALDDITAVEEAGLITAKKGKFKPEEFITNGEMDLIISQIAKKAGVEPIKSLKKTDLDEYVTRAEAVVRVNLLIGITISNKVDGIFGDVRTEYWAYNHIALASKKRYSVNK